MITPAALIELFLYALANSWGYIWGQWGALWTESKQAQKVSYMAGKYGSNWKNSSEAKQDNYYQAALNGGKWVNHYVADCSGLFRWAYSKLGFSITHSSNYIWTSHCSKKGELKNGKKEDGSDVRPGTAVFVHPAGNSKRTHIGLYIGDGRVIEAASTVKGVIESKITDKKWNEWGELKKVDYGTEPTPSPTPSPTPPPDKPTLRRGDKGAYVTLAQTELIQKGYSCGSSGADGAFGKNTEAAVKAFQKDHGLTVDGVIGQNTWAALDSTEPAKYYTVTVHNLTETQADALILQYPGSEKTEEGRG